MTGQERLIEGWYNPFLLGRSSLCPMDSRLCGPTAWKQPLKKGLYIEVGHPVVIKIYKCRERSRPALPLFLCWKVSLF